MEIIGAAPVVLRLAEIGQHVGKAPARIAELAPVIEILRLPANVDQPVDRARPAENFSPRCDAVAVMAAGLRLGRVAPVEPAIGEQLAVAERNMQPGMPVAGTGL